MKFSSLIVQIRLGNAGIVQNEIAGQEGEIPFYKWVWPP